MHNETNFQDVLFRFSNFLINQMEYDNAKDAEWEKIVYVDNITYFAERCIIFSSIKSNSAMHGNNINYNVSRF